MAKSHHTDLYRKLAVELKVARVRSGMKQQEVADKLGEAQSYVSKVELGERRLDVVELQKLCRVYDLELTAFLKELGFD